MCTQTKEFELFYFMNNPENCCSAPIEQGSQSRDKILNRKTGHTNSQIYIYKYKNDVVK